MRRNFFWMAAVALIALILAFWSVWTWRLSQMNRDLALQLEAERQRNFNEMVYHVEQIQTLLGKGLVTGSVRQNMRYLSDAYHHSQAAVANFIALPLPAEISAQTGKFLQQTGDFAVSLLRHEAAGREMDMKSRRELMQLRQHASNLSTQFNQLAAESNQKGTPRWHPPVSFSWAALLGRNPVTRGKPTQEPQAATNMIPGGWVQIGSTLEKLPVLLYDGPFSDHVSKRNPAMSGAAITREEASRRIAAYIPEMSRYTIAGVSEVGGTISAYSFKLAPAAGKAGETGYTLTAEVTKNGGFLLHLLNGRVVGRPTIDLPRADSLGQQYLASIGYPSMVATYAQVEEGAATIAYAFKERGVIAYPDQIKVKVALDNGEILAVDARQYLMSHHNRTLKQPELTPQQAEEALNPDLQIKRMQLALIPDQAGTGEILAYEFLTVHGTETFLVYINTETGVEEQILQQVNTDGGTFVL